MPSDPGAARWLVALTEQLAWHDQPRAPAGDAPLALVRRHGLAPLAHRAGVAALRPDFARGSMLDAERSHALAGVIDELARAHVPAILLKGVAYARTLYAHPAERPMTDIDLLVTADRHAAGQRVLARLGFERVPGAPLHHASTHVRGEVVVDLHHAIVHPLRGAIEMAEVWRRATPATWLPAASLLEPVDEAVFHFVHLTRHRLHGPLIGYVDAGRLLRRLGEDAVARVVEQARRWRLGRAVTEAVAATLAVTRGKPGPRWPAPTVEEIVVGREPDGVRKLVYDATRVDGPRQLVGWLLTAATDHLGRLRTSRGPTRPASPPARARR